LGFHDPEPPFAQCIVKFGHVRSGIMALGTYITSLWDGDLVLPLSFLHTCASMPLGCHYFIMVSLYHLPASSLELTLNHYIHSLVFWVPPFISKVHSSVPFLIYFTYHAHLFILVPQHHLNRHHSIYDSYRHLPSLLFKLTTELSYRSLIFWWSPSISKVNTTISFQYAFTYHRTIKSPPTADLKLACVLLLLPLFRLPFYGTCLVLIRASFNKIACVFFPIRIAFFPIIIASEATTRTRSSRVGK